ncbi:MAG: hypothetical protein F4164_07565 [Gemmatimonadales bacterium]|nr:hypothetical protein [Gemmatimonadales bacterium]MYG49216.1 hypothetical protein [Gemmatimonadales bacterium]MYK01781.1 hypothetical protein [Candidatus Palauibacter ramosifaciens]
MRSYIVFLLLLSIKVAARVLCRVRLEWLRGADDPWSGLRVLALINHTSLFEPVFLAVVPSRVLWQLATHGVVPLADKTAARPILGRLFQLLAKHVVPVTREKDDTWERVLRQVRDPEAVLIILPEGRMMRRTGLDLQGNPMTIRGGIADILRAIPDGRLFIGYSGGLHHIQAPGERFPRPFRSAWLGAEVVDIAEYRRELGGSECAETFKAAVIEDLTRRRDAYCCRNG